MMTEAAHEVLPTGPVAKVGFFGVELRAQFMARAESEGWLTVRVALPGTHGRGRLAVVLEESIEKALELRGACPPGIGACSDSDASLSDQLYRARLLGAPGLALAIERLEAIANHAGALDAEDSAVLRWWVMTARERPLRLYFDARDESLGIYTAPTHFGAFVRQAEIDDSRPSTPPPMDSQMEASLRSMQSLPEYAMESEPEFGDTAALSAPVASANDTNDSLCGEFDSSEPPISAVFGTTEELFANELTLVGGTDESELAETDDELRETSGTDSPATDIGEALAKLVELNQAEMTAAELRDALSKASASEAALESADCSALVGFCAAEPATPPSPKAKLRSTNATLPSLSVPERVAPVQSAPVHETALDAAPREQVAREFSVTLPLFPDAAERWREWMRMLDQARGPRPLAAVEQLYVNAYVPLYDAAVRGIADPAAFEVLETWSSSFAKSYREAFDALRLRGKRPMMVLDVADAAHRLGRLHGARSVQLVLVDGLRFDLGLRLEARMRMQLGQQAAMTERLLLWSALPSNTATQLELLGRGPEGLKNYEPPSETNAFVSHGRAAATLRRVRTGSRDVMKLDMVSARLAEPGIGSPEGLDELADDVAAALSTALLKFAPRTMAVVFGDHGFIADRSQNWSNPTRHGGSSPEEVLVPAFAWLVGATH